MENNSSELIQEEKKSFHITDFIPLRFIYTLTLLLITASIVFVISKIYDQKVEEYRQAVFKKTSKKIHKTFDILFNETLNNSTLLANTISKHYKIRNSLKSNNPSYLDLSTIQKDIQTNYGYQNSRIEIVDKYGKPFKKSWNVTTLEDINYMQLQIMKLIDSPEKQTHLYTSKVGFSIANIVPIYDDKEFLGLFILHSNFDDLASIVAKSGYQTVMVLNEKDSIKINQNQSYTKRFVDNHYVVNSNSEPYLERLLNEYDIRTMQKKWTDNYKELKSAELLVTKYSIEDYYFRKKVQAFIFMNIDNIDLSDMELITKWYYALAFMLILTSLFIVYYFYSTTFEKELSKDNSSLILINEHLKEKTDLLDFNEKKTENLFNAQPNLMIMHNGREVTQGNKRFMGFFNRFGSFEGFKKEHKCVSELFEKYEAPNYIWEEYIDGLFWVDYISKNPRKFYKTVMSIENRKGEIEAHHFIIKLNEIKYAAHVNERIIIIALVDMTQDLVNYKSLDDLTI